jgi:hypothetical protein
MFYRDQKATSPIRKRILSLLRATGYVKIQLGEPPLWRLLDPLGEHQLFLPAMDGGPLIWSVGCSSRRPRSTRSWRDQLAHRPALGRDEPGHRSVSALPQAVLGVKVVERLSRVA